VTDSIVLRNLAVFARHGVHPEEATLGQRFTLDVTLRLDLRAAGGSDRLADTVDYGAVVAIVTDRFAERRKLIEAAAQHVADGLLERFPQIAAVEVAVRKPGAPIAAIFDWLEVRICRTRP
jgi:dihydroneopterin aldolase